jgi:hypothetical protein
VATGIAAAAIKKQKGRKDVRVVAQGGDGGTTDIGFGCLSGMFERNDDVLYICYDNEAYMNTGVQRSSATPPAARTATTMAVGPEPGNPFGQGKNVPAIAMAHGIPYVATATVADLRDLEEQGDRAMAPARRALHPHPGALPARLGHGLARHHQAGAAGQGDRPLPGVRGRARRGQSRTPIRHRCRWRTTSSRRSASPTSSARTPPSTPSPASRPGRPQHPQIRPDSTRRLRAMDKPFAITLDPGSSLANRTGSWRTARPVYVDRLPPCKRLPGRREHPGLAVPRRIRRLRSRLAPAGANNPLPAIMGRVCYHTCENACNRGKIDEAVGINSVERFLGDEAIKRGWKFAAPAKDIRQARAGRRRRPPGCRPPTTCAAWATP